jgi:6-pyruvoyltetrahydropterin/6-carboxytetrahydropterin synthase
MATIFVRHNIEIAHRLTQLPGKCEQIHGHSMWVELHLHGQINAQGILDGRDFGYIKKLFREYLDTHYDHHLLLNEADPFACTLYSPDLPSGQDMQLGTLPGLRCFPGDPTTENIAKWVATWAARTFAASVDVRVDETCTNGATYSARHVNGD